MQRTFGERPRWGTVPHSSAFGLTLPAAALLSLGPLPLHPPVQAPALASDVEGMGWGGGA